MRLLRIRRWYHRRVRDYERFMLRQFIENDLDYRLLTSKIDRILGSWIKIISMPLLAFNSFIKKKMTHYDSIEEMKEVPFWNWCLRFCFDIIFDIITILLSFPYILYISIFSYPQSGFYFMTMRIKKSEAGGTAIENKWYVFLDGLVQRNHTYCGYYCNYAQWPLTGQHHEVLHLVIEDLESREVTVRFDNLWYNNHEVRRAFNYCILTNDIMAIESSYSSGELDRERTMGVVI